MKIFNILSLSIYHLCIIGCSEKPEAGKQVLITEGFSNKVLDAYWLYLPKNYDKNRKWPMIMFLQGGDASASPNPNTVKDGGPINYILKQHRALPDSFVLINPHMRTGTMEQRQWSKNANSLIQIINHSVAHNNVDPNRIYLTGISRGGLGTWGVAKKFPEKFAAIVPIAGAITCKSDCEKITDLPMWIIHNVGDPVVEYDYPEETIDFLEKELGKSFLRISNLVTDKMSNDTKYIFTSFESDKHGGAGSKVYSSAEVYQWLLDKKKN
ncbi:MAG: prolyl oligopeptidase family serine peptidase [Reichenbachiella sp.]